MTTLRCDEVRDSLCALRADRLSATEGEAVREHLASCADCRAADRADAALTELLVRRMPRPAAPQALQQRLSAMIGAASAISAASAPAPSEPRNQELRGPTRLSEQDELPRRPTRLWVGLSMGGTLAAAALALLIVLRPSNPTQTPLLNEVVNDHLRVLYAQNPIEIESGGIHQVKPWFEGRLDFAPRVLVEDDPDFPLRGGAVSYVLDRKAAVFVFKRRLHTISLFVFRNEGLPWPRAQEQKLGASHAEYASQRGFNVLFFQRQDLGYALVSDLNLRELSELGTKLAQP